MGLLTGIKERFGLNKQAPIVEENSQIILKKENGSIDSQITLLESKITFLLLKLENLDNDIYNKYNKA